ncbi:hypothetical protein FC18_GL001645 [Lacticaseibacillus sharpeae JCM 1186 = DSM 20505]|uniref:Uncharacterized protein n=1 Tax=Lacticaseibacillus sharpeae JCM 1186 = DSM 20505 TaxID=1291052 RepID=A0A0R1ZT29_9LACO|nr:hypothetical protein FC18_GL001645 [Lacticaseibacillus sharpeae JCM 1186 = DSM 20505]
MPARFQLILQCLDGCCNPANLWEITVGKNTNVHLTHSKLVKNSLIIKIHVGRCNFILANVKDTQESSCK